ncbi:MAG: hypothetical protein K9K67_05935 [Bacteriovoracaceae bacterium]|nr:hypothetical protein [Bacteriovoracaceae bacterium]
MNDKSKQTASTLDKTKVQIQGRIIQVKVKESSVSPASKLSSRPVRSLFKAKSIMKPFASSKK